MKILLSAFTCDPTQGSEAGVGWGIVASVAKLHRVHVLTTPRHQAAIEQHLAAHPEPNLSFSYHDFPPFFLSLLTNSSVWQLYYHAWQHRIATWAAGVVAEFNPDIVHHITYGRYWTPSTLWRLGKPFVWGPLGGGDFCPKPFLSTLSFREKVAERLRGVAQWIAHQDPELRATARHAALAIASTPATRNRLQQLGCRRTTLLLQMALDADFVSAPRTPVARELIFCSIGRLLGWKGHSLTLRAFAAAAIPGARLLIIGVGPANDRLQQLAASLGVSTTVKFLGSVPRADVLCHLERSIALVHPSLHDQAPTVVFEAMALGTPVIALNLGGLPFQVKPGTGFLVPAETPAQAITGIADAMQRLAAEPELRSRLGQSAREHVAEYFTWEKKAGEFEKIYRTILAETKPAATAPAASAPAP